MSHRVGSAREEEERRRRVNWAPARRALIEQSLQNPCFDSMRRAHRTHVLRLPSAPQARPFTEAVNPRRGPRASPLCRNCEDDESLRCCRPCYDVFGDVDGPLGPRVMARARGNVTLRPLFRCSSRGASFMTSRSCSTDSLTATSPTIRVCFRTGARLLRLAPSPRGCHPSWSLTSVQWPREVFPRLAPGSTCP